jgi:hypothetical protein
MNFLLKLPERQMQAQVGRELGAGGAMARPSHPRPHQP